MKDMENIFDDNKLKKSLKKAKVKSTLRIISISLIVFIGGSILNTLICIILSQKNYEATEAYVKLTVPGAYISESTDFVGFLGGTGNYKVTKNIGFKPVTIEDRVSTFGLLPQIAVSRGQGAGYHIGDQWPVGIWENGYRKMRFFHPNLKYEEYQFDLADIDKIPEGKVIEMAISFDKPYKANELYTLQNQLKPASVSWLWLNEFTEDKIEEFKYEIENYDAKANGIEESEVLGIALSPFASIGTNPYEEKYEELVKYLGKSSSPDHKKLYEKLMKEGKTPLEEAEILGVIVQGTKEELKQLEGNPMIKATSIGIVSDPLY